MTGPGRLNPVESPATADELVVETTKAGFEGWAGDLWTFLHTNPVAWRLYGWVCWGTHLPTAERWVERQLDGHAPATVVDVPVGIGRLARFYAERLKPDRLIAVDVARAMVERAGDAFDRAGVRRYELETADVSELPIGSGEADLVVSEGGFHHFPDRLMAARELRRVLKRDGALIGYSLVGMGNLQGDFAFRRFHKARMMGTPLAEGELVVALIEAGFTRFRMRRHGAILGFNARP